MLELELETLDVVELERELLDLLELDLELVDKVLVDELLRLLEDRLLVLSSSVSRPRTMTK